MSASVCEQVITISQNLRQDITIIFVKRPKRLEKHMNIFRNFPMGKITNIC